VHAGPASVSEGEGIAMLTVPETEVRERVAAFRKGLDDRGLRGGLVTGRVDRYYLAGTAQDGLLWVDARTDPQLFVLRDVARARAETPFDVIPVTGRRELWNRARELFGRGGAGVTLDVLSSGDLRRLGITDLAAVADITPDLLAQRARKSPWEVLRMEETGRVAAQVYRHGVEILRPGMTEAEFAGQLFAKAMALGHEGTLRSRGELAAYSWHLLSGPNAAKPGAVDTPMSGEGLSPAFPWGASHRVIGRGEPVIVDFGISVFGYQTDQTRTFCIGPPPAWLEDAHAAILATHRAMIALLRPGTPVGEVFEQGRRVAHAHGLTDYLGHEGSRCRFVGHGVGLETVEPPVMAEGSGATLEASYAVALEPKAVVGEMGGVGVEDTLLVEDGGARPLAPIPLELIRV